MAVHQQVHPLCSSIASNGRAKAQYRLDVLRVRQDDPRAGLNGIMKPQHRPMMRIVGSESVRLGPSWVQD